MAIQILPLSNNRSAYLVIDNLPNIMLMNRTTWLIVALLKKNFANAEAEYLKLSEKYLPQQVAREKFSEVLKMLSELQIDFKNENCYSEQTNLEKNYDLKK